MKAELSNIAEMTANWLASKEIERLAIESRREIEDKMVEFFHINQQDEGTHNFNVETYKVKIVNRLTKKVDSDKLQEIANENGLSDHLSSLFRWKADLNSTAWKNCAVEITSILEDAITTMAGRPSFSIELIKEQK